MVHTKKYFFSKLCIYLSLKGLRTIIKVIKRDEYDKLKRKDKLDKRAYPTKLKSSFFSQESKQVRQVCLDR